MKRSYFVALVIIAFIVAATFYLNRPKPVSVVLASVEKQTVEATVTNTRAGTIKSCRRARVAPQSMGQVADLLVKKGDRVKQGQPLLRLWNDDLKAQLSLAQSQEAQAQAQMEQACLQADTAKREAERIASLFRKKLTSEEQRDRADSEARAQAAACRAAGANLQVMHDKVVLAQTSLDRSVLTAPFDGVVAELTGEPGEIVTPSMPGIPTPPAVDLIDPDCLYVSAPIDEVDAPRVELCMPVRVTLDAYPDQAYNGNVRRIANYVLDVEKQARTVEVEVYLSDPKALSNLLPGYSADVEIILEKHENVLRIPSEALVDDHWVYVYNPLDGTLAKRKVETGLSNWQYTEVTQGLSAGERVVTSVEREGLADGAMAEEEKTTEKNGS